MLFRAFPKVLGITSVSSLGTWMVIDQENKDKVRTNVNSAYRVANLVSTVSVMLVHYGYHLKIKEHKLTSQYDKLKDTLHDHQAKEELLVNSMIQAKNETDKAAAKKKVDEMRNKIVLLSEEMADISMASDSFLSNVHTINAKRLRRMCSENKGLYIKLGQHISMLDHIVPSEYQVELSNLLADNPASSYNTVREVVKSDLGSYPEELFDSFEKTPIASASLAQVHVAYKDKQKYAVKVQHGGLLEGSHGDMLVITWLVDLIPLIFEGFNYSWLTKEMNRNLPMELDFRCELQNLLKCQDYLKDLIKHGDVVLPQPERTMSSSRVLTMSFEPGVYVTKQQAIRDMHLSEAEIARIISLTFCEQIFKHGFVHCDPHEANILVRQHPTDSTRPQIVLLDHGLYRQLDDSFRLEYCRLWQSLILGNGADIEKHCRGLNAGSLFPLLAGLLTQRPWDDITSADMNRLKGNGSKGDTVMIKAYADKYFKEIIALLGMVPSELLLLFKTNDCLKHLDRHLGAPINTYAVLADVVSDVILHEDLADLQINLLSPSFYSQLTAIFSTWFRMKISIWGLALVAYSLHMKEYLQIWRQRVWSSMFGAWF